MYAGNPLAAEGRPPMRTRLVTITVVSLAAVLGFANAASAKLTGPGAIGQKPTTTTTAAPKGPDKLAPTPTTQPPQPGPKGPGDIAQPQPGPVVEPGPDTTGNGSGSDNYAPPAEDSTESADVQSETVDSSTNSDTEAAADETNSDSGVSPSVLLGFAVMTAGLIAFVIARRRSEDQDAEQL